MFFATSLTALALLTLGCLAAPAALEARQVSSPPVYLVKTSNYLSVASVKASNNTKQLSAAKLAAYGSAKLRDLQHEYDWAVKINLGGEDVFVVLDTGSSDLWVVQNGFQCYNGEGVEVADSECLFGPAHNGTFEKGEIEDVSSFLPLLDRGVPSLDLTETYDICSRDLQENFMLTYGGGTGGGNFVKGTLGYSDVTVGGIHVKKQEVALVNQAYFSGDGVTSGILGLAYSSLTDAYPGTNATADNSTLNRITYSPIFQTMIAQGLNPPIFSMALQRGAASGDNVPGGYIAFGGLPPVSVDPADFVSTPVLTYQFPGFPAFFATNRTFYTIKLDGYVYANKKGAVTTHATSIPAFIDSGNGPCLVPTAVAKGYLASFDSASECRSGRILLPLQCYGAGVWCQDCWDDLQYLVCGHFDPEYCVHGEWR